MRVPATFFDGRSAASRTGSILFDGRDLHFSSPEANFNFRLESSALISPVGRGNWVVEIPDGGRIEWQDREFGEYLASQFGHSGWVSRLEASWHWAVIALILAAAGGWAMLTYGVPVVARQVAFSMPPDIDRRISEESIEILDRVMFNESELPEPAKAEVWALFAEIKAEDSDYAGYRLIFRQSEKIGANAFALPGGLVIITDEMVELIKNDSELASVLAHEVGHLAERHSLRIILQNSASVVIIAGLTGDFSNVTALSATVPTVLMQAKYSRDFEREADNFAFHYLDEHDLDTDALSKLLQRVDGEGDDVADKLSTWFSSHPASVDRVPEVD
jgi:Zn-dependent protease with chaperone function